jgi:hypothetical protein
MLHFVNRIDSIGNVFAKKNLLLATKRFLDDRKDVFRMDRDTALFCFFLGCHEKPPGNIIIREEDCYDKQECQVVGGVTQAP